MGTNLSKENLKRKCDNSSDSKNLKKFKHPEAAKDDDQKELSFSLEDGWSFSVDSEGRDIFIYV